MFMNLFMRQDFHHHLLIIKMDFCLSDANKLMFGRLKSIKKLKLMLFKLKP